MLSLEGKLGVGACRALLDSVRDPSRDPKRVVASLNWLWRPDTNSCATSRAYTVLGVATSEPESSADSLAVVCSHMPHQDLTNMLPEQCE